MCIDFDGNHSGGSSIVNVKDFCYYINYVCVPTGTSSALRQNKSMRVPVYSLAPRTRFGSANRVGVGKGA